MSTFWTIFMDFIAWFIIHMGVVFLVVRIPTRFFNPNSFFYRSRTWEKGGLLYQKIFRIKKWKEHVPDGAGFLKERGFPKKRLKGKSSSYMNSFLLETCRAELSHWIIILFAPFFFLWNHFWVGLVMIIYALSENIPLIMVQRFNRCRFRRIIEKREFKILSAS